MITPISFKNLFNVMAKLEEFDTNKTLDAKVAAKSSLYTLKVFNKSKGVYAEFWLDNDVLTVLIWDNDSGEQLDHQTLTTEDDLDTFANEVYNELLNPTL